MTSSTVTIRSATLADIPFIVETIVSAEKFVQAFYGGSRTPQGGASTVPLDAIPRRIELQLRLLF